MLDQLFEELILAQQKKMLALAKIVVPGIIEEDLLQPFDYPELERYAPFRYEEGVLEGILTVRMAMLSLAREAPEAEFLS